jgi:hypothetical protein
MKPQRKKGRKPAIFSVGVSWSQTITNADGQPLYDRIRHVGQTATGGSIRRAISSALHKFFTDKKRRRERAAGHREIFIHAKRQSSCRRAPRAGRT